MEELAKLFIRQLLVQNREAFVENQILRHLLQKEQPQIPRDVWDTVVKNMMAHPEATKKIREPFDVESAKVLKAFDDQVELAKTKVLVAEEEKKLEDVMSKLVEVMRNLPPPKLPN